MEENKALKPTNDYIFKRIFSKKGNEDLLKDLLEGILEIKIDKIEVIQEVEIERIDIEDKTGVLDIKAIVDETTTIDIEIQVRNEYNMIERTLFYWSGLYYTGLKRGERFKEANKVVTINLLKFNMFEEKNYHRIGVIKEKEDNKILTDKLELHFIELPKFLQSKDGGNKKLRQWLDFICNEREEEVKMAVKENKKIAKAEEEWEYLKGDEAEKRIAFLRDKWERDWISNIEGAKERGFEIGLKEGKEIGIKEGIKEGKETGLKEGKKEGKKEGIKEGIKEGEQKAKEKIAIEMLKEGIQDKVIIKTTKIKKEELGKLKEKI